MTIREHFDELVGGICPEGLAAADRLALAERFFYAGACLGVDLAKDLYLRRRPVEDVVVYVREIDEYTERLRAEVRDQIARN